MEIQHEKTISEKLKEIIEKTKWTQAELAEILGVGAKSMSFWIRSIKQPGDENLKKIEAVYQKATSGALDNKKNAKELATKGINEDLRKRLKDEEDEVNRLSTKEYFEVKKKVFDLEKMNNSMIYLFPSTGKPSEGWYKIGGRSLLFYKFIIAPRIGRHTTTRLDTDDQYVFSHGIGSARGATAIIPQVKELGYQAYIDKDKVIVIKLGKDFSRLEIENLMEQERISRGVVSNMVKPKYNFPKLAQSLRTLAGYLPQKVSLIEKPYQPVMIDQLFRPTMDMMKIYQEMANGRIEKADAKREMLRRVDDLEAMLVFMDAGGMLNATARARLGGNIIEIAHKIEELL